MQAVTPQTVNNIILLINWTSEKGMQAVTPQTVNNIILLINWTSEKGMHVVVEQKLITNLVWPYHY